LPTIMPRVYTSHSLSGRLVCLNITKNKALQATPTCYNEHRKAIKHKPKRKHTMKTFLNMKTSQGRETVDQFDKAEGQSTKEYRAYALLPFCGHSIWF